MENIFYKGDYLSIVQRIESLSPSSKRLWGTLPLNEMLEHCSIQLKLALGEIQGNKNEASFLLRTAFGRWLALYGMRWQKGAATPAQMNVKKQDLQVKDIIYEKQQLLFYLKTILTKDGFSEHPFFGALSKKDWGRLIWKHLDHHLRQFNA